MADNSEDKTFARKIPTGTIVAFFGESVGGEEGHIGWLLCNGDKVDRDKYPKLHALLSDAKCMDENQVVITPNLRGLFLRGANLGRIDDWRDKGKRIGGSDMQKIGSLQKTANMKHRHNLELVPHEASPGIGCASGDMGASDRIAVSPQAWTDYTGKEESRPNNIYVNYLIKT